MTRLRVAVTGRPGIGKTTLCIKVFEAVKDKLDVEGFVTREVRINRARVGFKIVDLKSGEEMWLARAGDFSPVKVGRYSVFVESVDAVARRIYDYDSDLIIIDEIGPMELKSREFVGAIEDLISRDVNMLFTIHLKSKHGLLEKIRREFEVVVIDETNRDKASEVIIRKLGV